GILRRLKLTGHHVRPAVACEGDESRRGLRLGKDQRVDLLDVRRAEIVIESVSGRWSADFERAYQVVRGNAARAVPRNTIKTQFPCRVIERQVCQLVREDIGPLASGQLRLRS